MERPDLGDTFLLTALVLTPFPYYSPLDFATNLTVKGLNLCSI